MIPGIRILETFGHSPGHISVEVDCADGRNYICAGDSLFDLRNLDPIPELHYDIIPPGRFADVVATWNSVRKQKARVEDKHQILPAHDKTLPDRLAENPIIGGPMAPRAAIVGSWDTKREEMRFMFSRLAVSRLDPFYIDVSTLGTDPLDPGTGYSSDEIRRPRIAEWNALANSGRGEKIDSMVAAAAEFISRLHREGRINGIISAGGLQNTVLATSAMRRLPIGLPKVMVTTAATGPREFQLVTGNRDIIVVPSLSDLAGVNMFTRTTLDNACACLAGMLTLTEHPGEGIRRGSRRPVGLTQMGVTNTAAVAAIARLRELGFEPVGFHATGSGGPTMEECVGDGLLHGALDMTLHEIVSDAMGTGYSVGAKGRLERLLAGDAPVLLAPGGLDFIDDWTDTFPGGLEGHRFVLHNSNPAHIKLTVEEAVRVGSVIAAGPSAPLAFVLRDHGLVALGRDPIAAEHVAELVEETAMIAFLLGDSE